MEEKLIELFNFCKEHEKTCHEVSEILNINGETNSSWFASGQGCAYGTVAMTINQMIREIEKEGKEV